MRISKEDRDKRRKKFGDSRKNRGESYGAPTKTRVYNEYTGQYVTVTKDPGFGTSIEDKERVAGEAPSVGDTIDKRAPQGLITGTAIGASIGTKIAPGVGTAIGAGIGAAVGTAIGIAVGFKEGKEAVESYEETAQLGLELEAEQKQAEQDEEERMLKQQLQDEIRMQGQQNPLIRNRLLQCKIHIVVLIRVAVYKALMTLICSVTNQDTLEEKNKFLGRC